MRKQIIILISIVVLILAGLGFYGYNRVYKSISDQDIELYIYQHYNYNQIVDSIATQAGQLDRDLFNLLSGRMNYNDSTVKAGHYILEAGTNIPQVIRKLRSGDQTEVNVVLHNEQNIEQVSGKLSRYLAPDSTDFIDAFRSPSFQYNNNLDSIELIAQIIPNTYRMWWTTTPQDFINRMSAENKKFWDKNNRDKKAKDLGLSKTEVYTLASIVEKESQYKSERPKIAGVYLNRLKKDIALQADPTVLFAIGDFERYRVLKKDLEYDSPYNTYMYPGLPPGPIGLASISSIDAVLNYEEHNYYYFCAKPDNSGQHAFARTLNAHLVNARKFQKWLNEKRIYN